MGTPTRNGMRWGSVSTSDGTPGGGLGCDDHAVTTGARRRWVTPAGVAWMLMVVVAGELRDLPVDPVRAVVHLVLAALLASFVVRLVTRRSRGARD